MAEDWILAQVGLNKIFFAIEVNDRFSKGITIKLRGIIRVWVYR
ncbi:hypothetical protein EHW99_3584 [Erwinia amylovora]|uniref:Uncharacterized protein n=3 Tax=Erwinia amylovora TaxID=552 RepID=A0A831A8M7_ERWAM|nr:hypothetical protein EaACW_3660 [Erwinia amylovora ACW56400]QJQ56283.1 hypothetical protein EHX00_3584 [Erwinia amylovora]CBA24046.1 hypothetical protein predicted by Glimmer/Critica [Erwinia amylovora CFBP1430]CBX82518.1 hypothetical protein predicted by Glimmer/Critica [Erwinia amylovora ATCC BAA-2158]CCO80492.1 hypothetical protein BN432_3725 [Erwinia amylovora Ea356]CCO84302.1 hypothetical protein BN433_3758 [Erwinia amylovora Ea266]CCO88058.1 hypothetical protein BN434_3700 [Erwinia a